MSTLSEKEMSVLEERQADFALALLREVTHGAHPPVSTVLSSLSVAFPLVMVYAGARDQTWEEFHKLLAGAEKSVSESSIHAYFGDLFKSFQQPNENFTLAVANRIYKINRYVEDATLNKISDLVTGDELDEATRLLLINAVYFKARWAEPFDPRDTRKRPFYVSEGNQIEVDMMSDDDQYICFRNDELELLGVPYVGGEMFMFFLLPNKRFGLREMLANLNGQKLLELLGKRKKHRVEVHLPKFELETKHELNKPLENLGLRTAFTDQANFTGITPDEPIKIGKVLQKAYIMMNETGTEAVAATAGKWVFCCEPPRFIANHPFAFFLVVDSTPRISPSTNNNARTTTILFSGIYAGPTVSDGPSQ